MSGLITYQKLAILEVGANGMDINTFNTQAELAHAAVRHVLARHQTDPEQMHAFLQEVIEEGERYIKSWQDEEEDCGFEEV